MPEQDESQLGQNTDKAVDSVKEVGKKAGKAGGKAAKWGGKKAIGKLMGGAKRKAALLAVKGAAVLIKAFIAVMMAFLPYILAIFALVAFVVFINHIFIDSRGAQQEYNIEDTETMNEYTDIVNEYGDPEIMALSEENAFLQIFYQNEVEQSYWKFYEDDDDIVLDFAGGREPLNADVQDKYGREKFFQLTAMNLYALDEHLNGLEAITPQTFIQPVSFTLENDELAFQPLTDENGNLVVQSHKFEQEGEDDEGTPLYRKVYDDDENPVLTEGVWDYGFAPVYHYESFTEERQFRSAITGAEIWDIDEQRMRPMTPEELHQFTENGQVAVYDEWRSEFSLESGQSRARGSASDIELIEDIEDVDVWMIKDAVTPMGIIRNEIEQVWQPTNEIRNQSHTIVKNVPIEKEREVQATDDNGNPLWYAMDPQARYVRERTPLNQTGIDGPRPIRDTDPSVNWYGWGVVPTGFPSLPSTPEDEYRVLQDVPQGWTIEWRWVPTTRHTTEPGNDAQIVWTTETYYELIEKEHTVQTQGMQWENIPRYVGEPDTSELSGIDYYIEYFENYENYVTADSLENNPIDYLNRAKEEEADGVYNQVNQQHGQSPWYDAPKSIEERLEGEPPNRNEHPLMKEVRSLQLQHLHSSSRSHVDLSDIDFGVESDSEAVQNATEFISEFIEYGNRYGVDPMMLIALAAHESNGRHFANAGEKQSSGVRRSYTYPENVGGEADAAAIGIMQVRPLNRGNASYARPVNAFNQETGQMESFSATASELHDPAVNIRFGAMLISSEIRQANHDILTGMASYHYGIRFTRFVQNNGYGSWSPEAAQAYIDSGEAGVAGYIQQVLKYYLPMEDYPYPWAMDEDGNKIGQELDGVEFASGEAVNIDVANSVARQRRGSGGALQKGAEILAEKIVDDWAMPTFRFLAQVGGWFADGLRTLTNFIGLTSNMDRTDYYRIENTVAGQAGRTLLFTMMAYEEGLYVNEYEELDPEDFEERFIQSFTQHVRQTDRTGMRINPLEFFPDGHEKPVASVDITSEYGSRMESEAHQPGIQLGVPGSTRVYAVADGTIESIGEHDIVINHGNGVKTFYSQLGEIVISDYEPGDAITKGQTLARGARKDAPSAMEPDSFFFQLERGGRFMDPTWIVDPSVISGGSLGIDPNATDFQHPYYGQPSGSYSLTSPWGWRIHPIYGDRRHHAGQDWGTGGVNLPVGSIGDGVVTHSQYHNSWGHLVVVHHDDVDLGDGRNVYSLYAHLSSSSPLPVGHRVTRGDILGNTGTTGDSTGIHLHLEVIVMNGTTPLSRNGVNQTIDPMSVLP